MRFLTTSLLMLLAWAAQAAVPRLEDFNPTQFGTPGGIITITNGAKLTNPVVVGPAASKLLRTDANNKVTDVTIGANLTFDGTTLSGPAGVGITNGVAPISVTESNVFLSGNIAYTNLANAAINVATRAAMEALTGLSDGTPVILKGYYVAGDAPTVLYRFVLGDTTAPDGGSVITNAAGRFRLMPSSGRIDVRNFGLVNDDLENIPAVWTNNSTTLTFTNALPTNYVGKVVSLRRGGTSVGAEVTLLPSDLSGTTILSFTVVSNGQGYINVPTNVLVSGPGSGATTTCVLTDGQLTSITVTGGGTGYTTNSIFKIRSTDCGTTNAPYHSEQFTVVSQTSSNLVLSGTPFFSEPLNPNDDRGVFRVYTDNQTNLQACVDFAYAQGLETYFPAGNWGTGPIYVNHNQRLVGAGQELTRVHSASKIGFTTFRKSVFMPKNVNFVNGRHSSTNLLPNCEFTGFTINGAADHQDPLGTSLNSGTFAVFGINCAGVINWNINKMTITNCQGGAVYFGSFAPPSGLGADYPLVQSKYITVKDCYFINNWRQAHQMGNCKRLVEENTKIIDSSWGYWQSQVARNLIQGNQVGQNGTYSPEQIDAEANASATSGYYKFVDCWMENKYGSAINVFVDNEHVDMENCIFWNCYAGSIITAPSGLSSVPGLNNDWSHEWLTINGCRFFSTTTNNGPFLNLRQRGVKVVNCTFDGHNPLSGQGDVIVDLNANINPPGYEDYGFIFANNTFNLHATADDTSVVKPTGTINIMPGNGYFGHTRGFIWSGNTIVAGLLAMGRAATEPSIGAVQQIGSALGQEGSVWVAAGGNPTSQSVPGTNGLGTNEFTFYMKFARSALGTATEFFRYGTELTIQDTVGSVSNLFSISWNPNGAGSTTWFVPITAMRDRSLSLYAAPTRPINVTLTRRRGYVFGAKVLAAGSGYTASQPGLLCTLSSATGSGAVVYAMSDSAGTITNAFVSAQGTGYIGANPTVTSIAGGGVGAQVDVSSARLEVWADDQLLWFDASTNWAATMSSSGQQIQVGRFGLGNMPFYEYALYNRALDETGLRRLMLYGPEPADRWGKFASTLGCVAYVKLNSGIGQFFEDRSDNGLHLWYNTAAIHGVPKNSGRVLRRLAVTASSGATNGVNVAAAAATVIPAGARITGIYAIPQSGAAPTVRIGFDSAITDQLVPPQSLTANVTNYLRLIPGMTLGQTNRPVYIGQTGAATNDFVIQYSLDQGIVSGPILGVPDDSAPAAGQVGETIASAVAVGAAQPLVTGVATNITSIALTPGDWFVTGNVNMAANAATVTDSAGAISTVTQTLPTDGSEVPQLWGITTLTVNSGAPVTTAQVKSSTNITVYLVGSANFSAGSMSAYGSIKARRAR